MACAHPGCSDPMPRWLPCFPLGSGSFGHVSLALNLDDSYLFAVKTALCTSTPELLALQNELHILQSLHSPFIIQCLGAEFSTVSGGARPAICNLFLEYMDGGNLADALRQSGGRLCEETSVRHFTRSILRGLAYLHENGIVHCDIKSQNILLASSGAVKIADFGAARRLGEASSQSDGNLRGTPLWMAPEVAVGGEPMPASDIWSLGCTVVEMLQGRPPWGDVSSVAAALFKVGYSSEIPPLPKSISARARDFLLNCLRRDPKKRWTAEELLEHPFVSNLEEAGEEKCRRGRLEKAGDACVRKVQVEQPSLSSSPSASPRSTLDFFHNDSESEWEEDSCSDTMLRLLLCSLSRSPTCRVEAAGFTAAQASTDVPQEGEWIIVKRREGWSETRQAPFMQVGAGQVVTRGCDVNLASAGFLRNRIKLSVG